MWGESRHSNCFVVETITTDVVLVSGSMFLKSLVCSKISSKAYINIYQRITVLADPGQALGSDAGEKGDSGYSAKDVTMEGQ